MKSSPWLKPGAFGLRPACLVLLCGLLHLAAQPFDPAGHWQTRSSPAGLEPRHIHTALWTGSEMIVWGGEGPQKTFKTGGRYDPQTDSWKLMTTNNAPGRRTEHRAVWTGTEMLVWGGFGQDAATNTANGFAYGDGGRYNPAADSWQTISSTNAPAFRMGHTAVWTGTEMLVWGGYHGTTWYGGLTDEAFYSDGARYHPDTDTWAPLATQGAPSQRAGHVAVWTGTEMLVWGGYYRGQVQGDGARYNPTTDTWAPISAVNGPARIWPFSVWTGKEMIVWGGLQTSSTGASGGARYDPGTDSWSPMSTAAEPSMRYSVAQGDSVAIWTGHEMMVWGQFGLPSGYPQTGGRYDPGKDTWSPTSLTSAPLGRSASLVWTGREVLLFGGWRGTYHTETYAYFPPAPLITQQPQSRNVPRERGVTFTVAAQSGAPLSYRWFVDSREISAATNASLTLDPVQLTDAGQYTVEVSNAFGSALSNAATLVVEDVDSAELDARFYVGLTILGTVGKTYRIEYADDSAPGSWRALVTLTLTNSPYLWFDADSANRLSRFYRAVLVP